MKERFSNVLSWFGIKVGMIGTDKIKDSSALMLAKADRTEPMVLTEDPQSEDPQVVHYGKPGTGFELKEGMTFTIEPMLNAGRAAVKELPDQWTVVTKDHSLSAQWEHTVLVTRDGHEVLTLRDGAL